MFRFEDRNRTGLPLLVNRLALAANPDSNLCDISQILLRLIRHEHARPERNAVNIIIARLNCLRLAPSSSLDPLVLPHRENPTLMMEEPKLLRQHAVVTNARMHSPASFISDCIRLEEGCMKHAPQMRDGRLGAVAHQLRFARVHATDRRAARQADGRREGDVFLRSDVDDREGAAQAEAAGGGAAGVGGEGEKEVEGEEDETGGMHCRSRFRGLGGLLCMQRVLWMAFGMRSWRR